MRRIRLRLVWLLVIPFLWYAAPTPASLAVGGVLTVVGLVIRAWAAGFIRKEERLATGGPYAHTRNPLYLGSFFLGLGVVLAGSRWVFVALFLAFFAAVYGRVIRGEARLMEELFGDHYRRWAASVPLFLPRPTPYRDPEGDGGGSFTVERWKGNKEYEALLGAVAGFAFLTVRMFLG